MSKSIAWSCVQLFCEASSLNDKESVKRQRLKTSFTKAKNAIFASDPTLLFCDITINPGEVKKFEAKHLIPLLDVPPSFKVFLKKNFFLKFF